MKLCDYDYIIIGGGASGLSMAMALLESGFLRTKRLAIIERRSQYTQDKSWCGWNVFSHRFENCVTKAWKKWEISYLGKTICQHSNNYQYQYIPSHIFYEYCLKILREAKNVDIFLNCTVRAIQENTVYTNVENFTGKKIYDAREVNLSLDQLTPKDNYLLQCFYGWHIKTKKAIFDDSTLTLMDFPEDQTAGINFIYLLPFSENEALIEPTFFLHHNEIPSKETFWEAAKTYLQNRYQCQEFEILHEESGVLPMLCKRDWSEGIGSNAGLLRPASGYAFYGIQRYINNIIENNNAVPYSKTSVFMDKIFLAVCRDQPRQGAKLFFRFFEKICPDSVVRFMHDDAKIKDYLNVIKGMPKIKFIKTAINQILKDKFSG